MVATRDPGGAPSSSRGRRSSLWRDLLSPPEFYRERRDVAREQYLAMLGELVDGEEMRIRPDRLDAAHFLEHAQHVVMDDAHARQIVERRVALDHRDAMAGAAQQDRSQHAGGSISHDDDVIHRASPFRRLSA